MKQSKARIDLTNGPVLKTLILFALPILGGSIVSQLYSLADSVVVGQFIGKDALAAVSASVPVTTIMNLFLIGLSAGSTVLIAHSSGSGSSEILQRNLHSIAFLSLMISMILTVVGLIICRPLLVWMGTPSDILNDANLYLIIIFCGAVGQTIYQIGSGALNGMGDSAWSFIFLAICSGLNLILDLLAIAVLGWGVWGAAIATAISQMISGISILLRINSGVYGVKLRLRHLRMVTDDVKEIIRIGLPASIQNACTSFAAICVQSYINTFGVAFIAANTIVTRVDMFATMPALAIGTAMSSFVGQNIMNNKKRVKQGINAGILSGLIIGGVLGILIALLSNILPHAFNNDANVVGIASTGLLITAACAAFQGADSCLVNAMRGAGLSMIPMITSALGAFSRIPLVYVLAVRTGNSDGAFWAVLFAAIIRAMAIILYYYVFGGRNVINKYGVRD